MTEEQQEVLKEIEVLFKSADTGNAIHWELAKYVFNSLNAAELCLKTEWANRAGADDIEYINALVSVRDKFKHLYSDTNVLNDGSLYPEYCHDMIIDILDEYDFSSSSGEIIFNGIQFEVLKMQYNKHADSMAVIEKLKKIQENMKPQN